MALRRIQSRLLLAIALVAASVGACAALRSQHHPASAPQTSTAPDAAASGALLTVTITDLRNRKGDLIFGVFTQADGFPNVQDKSVYWEVKPAEGGTDAGAGADGGAGVDTVTFTTRLPPGRYGAGVLHDENRSGDMDKNLLGMPLEGYGVTNNPKPSLRKATFEEATFTLPPEGAAMTISLQYF